MVAVAAQCQAFVAGGKVAARQPRAQRTVRVSCQQQEAPAAPLRFLAAGLAAAALAVAPMAQAKVILVQPEVKNFVSDSPNAIANEKRAAGRKAEKASEPKASYSYKEESPPPGFAFESLRPLVLPVALFGVAGAGAVAVKLDPEFADLFDKTWSAKDSNSTGAGYEVAPGLKDGPFYGGSDAGGASAKRSSAKPAKKSTTGTIKKTVSGKAAPKAAAGGNPLANLFKRD